MSAATVFADNNRYDDKRVKFRKEWAEYEKAGQKDLPKTQEKILMKANAYNHPTCPDRTGIEI